MWLYTTNALYSEMNQGMRNDIETILRKCAGYIHELRDCFRSIHDVALDGLLAWIMEPMKPFLQDITTVDWVKHSKMRLMLDTLAICCTELERYILPRVFKKVMDMVMHSLIDLYVKELLKLPEGAFPIPWQPPPPRPAGRRKEDGIEVASQRPDTPSG